MKELNKKRKKKGLLELQFDDLNDKILQVPLKNSKNHKNHDNLSVGAIIKPKENQIKPNLSNRIKELKEYCEKLKQQGNKITYAALCFAFDTDFIEKCKHDKILISLPKGDYDI